MLEKIYRPTFIKKVKITALHLVNKNENRFLCVSKIPYNNCGEL